MKKIFLLLISLVLVFASCDDFMPLEEEKTEQEENGGSEDGEGGNEDSGEGEGSGDGTGEGGAGEGGADEGGTGDGGNNGGTEGSGGNSGEQGGDGTGDEGGSGEGTEDEPQNPGEELTPDAQKVKLEQVGKRLLELYPASDYAELDELSRHFEDKYLNDDYNWDAFWNRYDEVFETSYTEERTPGGWDYEVVLMLSQCTGTFTLNDDAASFSPNPSNKTILKFTDMNGKPCSATITQVGKTQEIYVGHYWDDWDWDRNMVKTDNYYVRVFLPERITAEVVIGSGQYVTAAFDYDINFSPEGADITTDNVSVKVKAQFSDTEINLTRAHCDALTGKVSFSYNMKKGGRHLMSVSGEGNGKIRVVEETYENGRREQWVEVLSVSNVVLEADILGEIQLKGKCSNGYALYDYRCENDLSDVVNESARWADIVDEMNTMFDITMYYDRTSVKQASLELEPDVDIDHWNNTDHYYYYVMPVLCFNDGSKYSIEDYFTEDSFSTILDKSNDFLSAYIEMFDR